MKRSHRLLAATSGLLLLVAACADDDPGDGPETTEADATDDAAAEDDAVEQEDATDDTTEDAADDTTEETEEGDDAAAEGDATIAVGSTDIGDVLVDAEGMTLYMFDMDEQGGLSACYDDCASNWPPLTADGDPVAGDGVDGSLLGTSERDDGTMQVTYDGWPLYGFVGDQSPGDVAGQAVQDVWWVLDASGEPLREGAAAQEEDEDDGERSSY